MSNEAKVLLAIVGIAVCFVIGYLSTAGGTP